VNYKKSNLEMVNMNMIFNSPSVVANGTKEKDTISTNKAALAKLMAAWEAKQKSAKKFGSFGLLAVTLAACNSDDDDDAPVAAAVDTTPFNQADIDAAVSTAVAAVNTTLDDNAAINAAVANATSFTTLDGLVAAYNIVNVAATADPILKVATDFITGTSGDDTYVALQTGAAATETWGVADSIDGAGGTDTINLTNTEAAVPNAATITNVENMVYRSTDAGNASDFAMGSFPSVTNITLDRPAANVDVGGLDTTDTVTLLNLIATTDTTITYTTASGLATTLATAGDATSVTINGSTAGADVQFAGDIEAFTLVTTAATSLADLVFDGGTTSIVMDSGAATTVASTWTAAAATSLTINGAGKTTITPDLAAVTVTIDASGNTGGIDLDTGATAEATNAVATFDQNDLTITGTAAADTIDLSTTPAAREMQVNAGAGDDTVMVDEEVGDTPAAAATTAGDLIDGGDGADTLSYSATTALDATHETQYVNFETLQTTGTANVTMTNLDNFAAKNFKTTMSDADATNTTSVTAAFDDLLTGSTIEANAAAGLTTNDAVDVDGVVINANLTTDDASATAADSITFTLADGYQSVNDDDGAAGDFEIVTINSSGGTVAAPITHNLFDFNDADTININATGLGALTISSIVAATTTAVVATTSTQGITPTLTTAVLSYAGGTGNDKITLPTGALANGKTYTDAGGTADSIAATATASQAMGILAVSGYELVSVTTDTGGDTPTMDVRNVTGMTTLELISSNAGDTFTVNNVKTGTTILLSGATTTASVTTTVGDSATVQGFSFDTNVTTTSIVLDAGTATVNLNSGNGDLVVSDAMATVTGITGSGLKTVNMTGEDDLVLTNALPNTVTAVDASTSTGNNTIVTGTAGTAAAPLTVKGGNTVDTITAGAGFNTIQGGVGNDTLVSPATASVQDKFIFESAGSATTNGQDTITMQIGAATGWDVLDFSAFMPGGTVFQNGGAGTAMVAIANSATSDINITNQVVLLSNANGTLSDTAAKVAGLIDGASDAMSITAGGKGIVIEGSTTTAQKVLNGYFVHDANSDGDVSDAGEVFKVFVSNNNGYDLDAMVTANFDLIV
jgi:hypothetical protein